ncbi:CapA family protein [Anaerococcus sp. AGMB00486]|uniref:CapA family protein n=1 Tax=Anaerococcus faecalis TaxID=2742993 RepID=A0ABX2N8Z5_9FIRM|nr:CapA family protein [Anaerococcus faecalis]NVF10992.1 CapA family protein [Anaerococcus faecalis]
MKYTRKIIKILLFSLIFFSLSSCKVKNEEKINSKEVVSIVKLIDDIKNPEKTSDKDYKSNISTKIVNDKENKKNNNIEKIRIKAFGDIMAHMSQVNHAFYSAGQTAYDFSSQFSYIKDFVSDSDISIGNFETSVNPDKEASGYPMFTTPVDYIKDIKDTGFDILTTANNHSADSGEKGIFDTISYMNKNDIDHVGTRIKNGDKILYRNVGNIKLAVLSYTYGINGLESIITENEPEDLINYLDSELIKNDIEDAKKNKADLIICYPHWGNEYESYPSQAQVELGRNMIEWGANIVIGNHPHVVQPAESYKAKDGREGYIAYSCGNFISMQSLEGLGDIRTEQTVAFDIRVEKNIATGEIRLDKVEFYPIWVGHGYDDYGAYAKVYNTTDFLEGGKYYDQVDEVQRERIRQADSMVTDTINTKVD